MTTWQDEYATLLDDCLAEVRRLTDDYAAATHLLADRDAQIERLMAELATLRASAASVQADQRAEIDAANAAAAWCDKHKPNGGARGYCVICAGRALSAALSKISLLCSEPNEMDCSPYDVHCDELAVGSQVEKLIADLAAANAVSDELRADAGRYRHLRQFTSAGRNTVGRQIFVLPYVSPAGLDLFHGSVAQHLDAAIDAARALRNKEQG